MAASATTGQYTGFNPLTQAGVTTVGGLFGIVADQPKVADVAHVDPHTLTFPGNATAFSAPNARTCRRA